MANGALRVTNSGGQFGRTRSDFNVWGKNITRALLGDLPGACVACSCASTYYSYGFYVHGAFSDTTGWQLLACSQMGPFPRPLAWTAHMAPGHNYIPLGREMPLHAMTKAAVFFPFKVFEKGLEPPLCNSVWRLLVGADFLWGVCSQFCPESFFGTSGDSEPLGLGVGREVPPPPPSPCLVPNPPPPRPKAARPIKSTKAPCHSFNVIFNLNNHLLLQSWPNSALAQQLDLADGKLNGTHFGRPILVVKSNLVTTPHILAPEDVIGHMDGLDGAVDSRFHGAPIVPANTAALGSAEDMDNALIAHREAVDAKNNPCPHCGGTEHMPEPAKRAYGLLPPPSGEPTTARCVM